MSFSIVICTYNGANRLLFPLLAISQLEIPKDMSVEFILVDNASTDNTSTFCANYFEQNPPSFPWKIVQEANPGLVYARQKAIKEAKNSWIVFCDDDNVLFPDYLVQAHRIIDSEENIGALGGQGIAQLDGEKPGWLDSRGYSYAVGPQSNKSGELNKGRFLYGAGLILHKDSIKGLLNKGVKLVVQGRKGNILTAGDDLELSYLVSLVGKRLWYEESMKFYHRLGCEKLSEEYYFRMILGHIAAEGLLFPYQLLLENSKLGDISYFTEYAKKLGLCGALALKYALSNTLYPEHKKFFLLNWSRFLAYFDNQFVSYRQFKSLKKVQNSPNN